MKNIKDIFANKNIVFSIIVFQLILLLDAFTIVYIVFIEPEVGYTSNWDFLQGLLAVFLMFCTAFVLNLVYVGFSLTKLRTLTVLVPLIIVGIIMLFTSGIWGPALNILGPALSGIFFGFFYSIIFYGPAIWMYFRFKLAYVSVSWLSIVYLTSMLVASGLEIESGGSSQLTALIRPDYLLLTGIFFFLLILLLIFDFNQSLSRWTRIRSKHIKLPVFKTILPIMIIVFITTIVSNVLSPYLWKIIWEETESRRTDSEQVQMEDQLQNPNEGPAGNLESDQDKVKINANQELQDSIKQDSGNPDILFLVQVNSDPDEYAINSNVPDDYSYYWKMENMDTFSKEKGFYNNFSTDLEVWNYTSRLEKSTYFEYLKYEYLMSSTSISQTVTFVDLETNWVIGAEYQSKLRLLSGANRDIFFFKNRTVTSEAALPFTRSDSYEIISKVSELDLENKYDRQLLEKTSFSYSDYHAEEQQDVINYNTKFNDPDITELTESIINPNDSDLVQVETVRDYLLENYEYSLEPGSPENLSADNAGLERLKYFLFENKSGYCTYFASAMTAMLQSIDIPARVVGGFSQGIYSEELDSYVITSNNAHAWVEVYFLDYGWITFDPTPGLSEEEQQKQEKSLEKLLTQKRLEELEQKQNKALDQKERFDTEEEITPPAETPPWLEELSKSTSKLFEAMINILKYLIPLICLLLIALLILLPPFYNIGTDLYLEGKLVKKNDRDQIINYFKLFERKLRKYNKNSVRNHQETGKALLNRLSTQDWGNDEKFIQRLEQATEIYNRAMYRHSLIVSDLANMQLLTQELITNIHKKESELKKISSYWI